MSIQDLREHLKDIPGAERLVMQYEEGGKRQVYSIDNIGVFVSPAATPDEIKAAFLEAMKPPPEKTAVKKAKKAVAKKPAAKKTAKKRK